MADKGLEDLPEGTYWTSSLKSRLFGRLLAPSWWVGWSVAGIFSATIPSGKNMTDATTCEKTPPRPATAKENVQEKFSKANAGSK
jgi:hypothetical protein